MILPRSVIRVGKDRDEELRVLPGRQNMEKKTTMPPEEAQEELPVETLTPSHWLAGPLSSALDMTCLGYVRSTWP